MAERGAVEREAGTGPYEIPEEQDFPEPSFVEFPVISRAPYKFVNARKFAKRYGNFQRKEILKNFELAKGLAAEELQAELEGLTKFAPAAANLKRQEISADNLFNQEQRLRQLRSVMPGAEGMLRSQAKQAQELAKGEIPDFLSEAQDRALELGMRSRSADASTAGGFGATSSVARKASDLMSAEARYNMGLQEHQLRMQQIQYGNQLLGQNIQQQAGLLLSPTEYSDAGTQIKVMPEVGAGRLTAGALSEVNQLSTVPAELAYRSNIQQRQFVTQLEQQTRMFNAQGLYDASKTNAAISNEFALGEFQYDVGYAGTVAGVNSANNVNAQNLEQQQVYRDIYQDSFGQAQTAGQISAVSQGVAAVMPAVVNGISSMFGPSSSGGGYGPSPSEIDTGGGAMGVTSPEDIQFGAGGTPTVSGEPISSGGGGGSGYEFQGGDSSYGGDYGPSPSGISTDVGGGYDVGVMPKVGTAGYNFQQETGLQYRAAYPQDSQSILGMAGIFKGSSTSPKAVVMGADYQGKPVFSTAEALSGTDATAGATMMGTLADVLAPLRALSPEELQQVVGIGQTSSDPNLIAALDNAAGRGDANGFIAAGLGAFGIKMPESAYGTRPGQADPGSAAYAMFEAMQNWTQASPEQKGVLAAGFGLKASDVRDGKSLGAIVIPGTAKPGTKPATISHALNWARQGINPYPLVNKWPQYTNMSKLIATVDDPDMVAKLSAQFKLIGAGQNGAEVSGVSQASLQQAGWKPLPHMGVGAIVGNESSVIPNGYTKVYSGEGKMVAAPKGTAYTASNTIMKSAAPSPRPAILGNNPNQVASNILSLGSGAMNIYNMWNSGRGPVPSLIGTAGVVANAVDRYNYQQAGATKDPSKITNYSQAAAAAAQMYQAYMDAKNHNYVGAAGYGSAAAFNGMAAYARETGNAAMAARYSDYAGYAQAGLNFYQAYNAYQRGDKVGAAALTAGGVGELAGYGGAGLLASGAYTAYSGWGSGNTANGAIGGSMMLAGSAMMIGGPVGWAVGGGLMALSVLGNAIKTGKNEAQNERDNIREYWQKEGILVDKDYNITLADGTLANIGVDGHGGMHSVTNADRLAEAHRSGGKDDRTGKNALSAYDVDYTNDLDFVASMGGSTLARMLTGGSATNIDQIGGQLGNASIQNIGFNQAMSKENFEKMAANQRAMYAKVGLGSKADAYQLANQAFAEHRIDEIQHLQATQSLDMIFDKNGYDIAQKLMSGRDKGAQIAQENANAPIPKSAEGGLTEDQSGKKGTWAQSVAIMQERRKTAQPSYGRPRLPEGTEPTWANVAAGPDAENYPKPNPSAPPIEGGDSTWGSVVRARQGVPQPQLQQPPEFIPKSGTLRMSKEEIQARNAARYQMQAA